MLKGIQAVKRKLVVICQRQVLRAAGILLRFDETLEAFHNGSNFAILSVQPIKSSQHCSIVGHMESQ